jgi:hypothetical protein
MVFQRILRQIAGGDASQALPVQRIFHTWWPLALSWLLMAMEGPAISATMARLANPEITLAAYGGVVFPLALIIEAPVIMLLSASVALCKDLPSFKKVYRFMMITGAGLTLLHVLIAFTPLYDVVVLRILRVPVEIVAPARIGLMLMTPWTWSIAYRRFQQGILIRYGHSKAVGTGTLVRLSTLGGLLFAGYLVGNIPGIIVGTGAEAAAVMAEAAYAGWRARPVLHNQIVAQPIQEPLSWRQFYAFYIPLVFTSLLGLLWNSIGSAAISRMVRPLDSLAVWPVVTGLLFMLRSPGLAYNEVVVALLDQKGSSYSLRRFAWLIGSVNMVIQLLFTATPLAYFWFGTLSGLRPDLAQMAQMAFWLGLPLPIFSILQSWFQGAILFGKHTGGIPESVTVFLVTILIVLFVGINQQWVGLYVAMAAFTLANGTQAGWLWLRSRRVIGRIRMRDAAELS